MPDPVPASAPATITVATAAVADVPDALWPRLAALLSDDERVRAEGFLREAHRREFVAAHALKRLMLCQAAGGQPRDWVFEAGPNGKPRVVGPAPLHFNLSHSGGLVACALSADVALGLDVEAVDRPAPLEVADAHFSADECAWLAGLPEAERSLGFFRLWTLKEAVLKATGVGVTDGMHHFSVGFDPLRVSFEAPAPAAPGPWRLVQQPVGGGHLLALAWCGPEAVVSVQAVQLAEMLAMAQRAPLAGGATKTR